VIFHGRAPEFNSTEYFKYHMKNSTWEPGLGRSGIEQGGYQMLALLITMAIALFHEISRTRYQQKNVKQLKK
jgi:hypothetical protein